jgi:polysaccharide export outer membrane protein
MPALEAAIASRLKQGYLRDPDVTIEVDRYRPVFVMGEVGRPGQYSYVPGMTAQNAIAIAGGFTSRGNQRDVDVTRKINDRVITGRSTISAPVLAGDTIYVRERLF